MIGIDTITWQKLIRLRRTKWKLIIQEMIMEMNFFIMTEGKKEFEHRFSEDLDVLDEITILPLLKGPDYVKFLQAGLDSNDASLLEYAIQKKYRIVTEDYPMLAQGVSDQQNIEQLVDFCKELLVKDNYFSLREFRQLVMEFRKWKNITKKKENKLKVYLRERGFNDL